MLTAISSGRAGRVAIHNPEHCYLGNGYKVVDGVKLDAFGQAALYVAETTSGKFGIYSMGSGPQGGVVIKKHDMVMFRQAAAAKANTTGPAGKRTNPRAAARPPDPICRSLFL